MIDELRVTKTGSFHRLKRRLSATAVDDLFRKVRASEAAPSQSYFLHIREEHRDSRWSALAFSYERAPTFLEDTTAVRDRITGYILLVEHQGHLAIFKSKLEVPTEFSSRYLARVDASRVDAAIAQTDAKFEKLRLRNMSTSRQTLRAKTLEADNLENAIGSLGASRYVPQGYTVRAGANHFSATPSTGRISQRSDKTSYQELIEFAEEVIDAFARPTTATAPFIQTFARPIDLSSLPPDCQPSTLSIDVALLTEEIYENSTARLVRAVNNRYESLAKADVDQILALLGQTFEVSGHGKNLDISLGDETVGFVALNKSRIALKALDLPLINGIEVENTNLPVGSDPNRTPLRRHLDHNDAFIILFSDISIAYINGQLFRDNLLTGGGAAFLRYFRTEPLLARAVSEKGQFTARQTEFDETSTFGAIVRNIARDEDIIICDDLGDEWADFICVKTSSNPPLITFHHAKHGNLSMSASAFHVSVSQAIKNLGRLSLPAREVAAKLPGWRQNYRSDHVQTRIPRIVRGNAANLAQQIESVRTAPDTVRRVFIVTSSLSKNSLREVFTRLAQGQAPTPHFVQLYWLLTSFFSACTEVGAFGCVICQE